MVLLGSLGFTLSIIKMYWNKLLKISKVFYEADPQVIDELKFSDIFKDGAEWMHIRLQEIRGFQKSKFHKTNKYNIYGLLKYIVLLFTFFGAVLALWSLSIFLVPFSVLIFYFVEVHFLFLFPLLIDDVNKPLRESLKLTYEVSTFNAFLNVMPISIFMVIGLFNFKNPLKNWYIGCLSILFWYEDAIRNRL